MQTLLNADHAAQALVLPQGNQLNAENLSNKRKSLNKFNPDPGELAPGFWHFCKRISR